MTINHSCILFGMLTNCYKLVPNSKVMVDKIYYCYFWLQSIDLSLIKTTTDHKQ